MLAARRAACRIARPGTRNYQFRGFNSSQRIMSSKQIVKTSVPVGGPYNAAVKANGTVYCSGQIPAGADGQIVEGDIQAHTRQCISNLATVLADAGSSLDRLVKVNIFLSDMGNFASMNQVYAQMIPDPKPARSCVAVKTLPKNVDVEMECIALE